MPGPYGVDIPGNFAFYNKAVTDKQLPLPEPSAADFAERQAALIKSYRATIPAEKRATTCVDCGQCLPKCPQQIRIPNKMSRIVEMTRRRRR
jgi:predicted aldo/keto reductase-like oxidoreductase